jgi:hypothetical protein
VVGLDTVPGPTDKTGVDLLQGFGEVSLPLGDATVHLRGGRELIALGTERLVGLRYGPNIPQPFDGVRAIADAGFVRLQLMDLRPVAIGPDNFDDRASATRRLTAAYRNQTAQFDQGRGAEHRQTYGLRFFGEAGHWGWNWELMLQRGRFADAQIRAWSLGTETSYRIDPFTLRLRADIISGDHDPSDRTLQTFNPLFPKGKYFGELTPLGPSNIMNLHPGIDIDLAHHLTLGLAAIGYWRESLGDGIYGIAGNVLRDGRGSNARHIGNQQELVLNWHPHPLFNILASYSLFEPGEFIRQTGPANTIHMIGFEATWRL